MTVVRAIAGACLLLCLLQGCGDETPALIQDEAGLLSPDERSKLALHHSLLLVDHDIDYRLVTSEGTGDIDLAALQYFESLSVGSLSTRGRGLLLILDAGSSEVRLEVGFGLEGVFPDAFIAYLEQRQMVPFFVEKRIADGILASTELIVDRARKASQNAGWDDEIWMEGSGGAGASTSTRTAPGFAITPPAATGNEPSAESRSPADVIAVYLDAMKRRDNSADLDIYSPASRAMMQEWLMTPAQMDQLARTYAGCSRDELILSSSRDRAVIRYPIDQRQCAPWFLERRQGRWLLDLSMLQRAIRFGRSNAWHFDQTVSHPYEFAFADWTLDANGFPIRAKP